MIKHQIFVNKHYLFRLNETNIYKKSYAQKCPVEICPQMISPYATPNPNP